MNRAQGFVASAFVIVAAMGAASVYVLADDRPTRPDKTLTPGVVEDVTSAVVCYRGYSEAHRRPFGAPGEYERYVRVMNAYGLAKASWHSYQMDHLVPLCLGGADVEQNLWPQPLEEAHQKDRLEVKACRQVCAGERDLGEAQRWFQSWAR
jgi:hypothetical protein